MVTVQTTLGRLEGTKSGGVDAFKGVAFAGAPESELRHRPRITHVP